MSKYQLIALDMDGTLLNSKKEISRESIRMIKKAADAGKYVVLNTGRGPSELRDYADLIPELRYMNCTSGALIYDWKERKTIYSNPLSVEMIRQIMDIAKEEDTMLQFLSLESFVQKDRWEKMDQYHMGIYKDMFRIVAKKPEDIYKFYDTAPFPMEKLNIHHTSAEARARTEKRIRDNGLDVSMVYSEIASLEISAKGVDKGIGLKKLCEYLGISIENVIAVGDADNDLGALRSVGLAIAMGNAKENIKREADVVVADCDHEGCAEAIEKYLL
ncbi:MAG: Cof-type HAD-IIB family hydrolase [Lachnospiraceae bacterium]|nr:Cof-type HAD-IIB family hydrolase [Lachnospiraceae bacterium]